MASKVMTLSEAVGRFVHDGDTVAMGTALEPMIPFAAGHEIIRSQKRKLNLVGPISDLLFDQLIGAGCVEKITGAWVGNVSEGSGYNYRRAVEAGIPNPVKIDDHSNFTLALSLLAAQMGVPFLPTYTILGTDLMNRQQTFKEMRCPVTGDRLAAVPALHPDVTVLQIQRSDEQGNAHIWGNLGVSKEAAFAAKRIILCVEEIVDSDIITRDPGRTIVPGFLVDAVVHAPWGAHPSPMPGYYNRDHAHFGEYHKRTKVRDEFLDWLREWVTDLQGRAEYCEKLGKAKRESLRIKHPAPSLPVEYGY